MLSADEAILLEKKETVYGADEAPTGAANAILTRDLRIRPFVANELGRDLDGPFSGADPVLLTNKHVAFSFGIELAANGTSGPTITKPAWSDTLESCGFDVTTDLTASAEKIIFTPSALSGVGSVSSVSSYLNMSGQQHIALGCRGAWSMEFTDGYPMVKVDRAGLYVDPTSVPFPTADFSGFRAPLPIDADNTQTVIIDGYNATLFSLTAQSGQTPEVLNLPGSKSVEVMTRAITGKLVIAAPAISDKDFFTRVKSHSLVTLQIIHGTVPGDIVEVGAPAVQLVNPVYGDNQGVRTLEFDLRFTATSAGNDEISIITR